MNLWIINSVLKKKQEVKEVLILQNWEYFKRLKNPDKFFLTNQKQQLQQQQQQQQQQIMKGSTVLVVLLRLGPEKVGQGKLLNQTKT